MVAARASTADAADRVTPRPIGLRRGVSVIPALQQDADCRQRRQVDWGGDAQDVVAL
jgi:hypothetical protein